ncbi:MAG: LysR family transcriptional regulator [Alphaproteobacteria bacterium]|nr:LysR family transcriptional regulator [Alphaproteobacteria bacterium]OJV46817.1 MAG: hypothetical protein BGO28_04240 [Alphaproteobacteria bacterium 43-37]
MIDIDLLKTFMTVVQCKTLTEASEVIGVEQPTVSRRIKRLEEQLGDVELLKAYSTGLILTEAGQYLEQHASNIYENVEKLTADIREIQYGASGELRVIGENFCRAFISEYGGEFHVRYPTVFLNVRAEESKALTYAGQLNGAFVGLTGLPIPNNSLFIWKELGKAEFYPYAHKSYIDKYGLPETFEDLDCHNIFRYEWNNAYTDYRDDAKNNPLLYLGRKCSSPRAHTAIMDDTVQCKLLIQNGLGIGTIPKYLARNTEFIQLFQGLYDPAMSIGGAVNLVYPAYGKDNAKIRAFRDFMLSTLKSDISKTWLQNHSFK